MVCCVIKVRVFAQQGRVPRVFIILLAGEMCPLTSQGLTHTSRHLVLDYEHLPLHRVSILCN